ncbi:MAG: cysteine desulfurase NifS [Candidatus Coatesbacteria bacterium 4484_99]|uniref:Cysteine desulfurase n=1 Tax=Candidatus Coatesbacteria bacterium 4484_99 TaxID=1970774 RepID=A0A1W9S1V3_9BACT|nr:MAG: cysteine desulfurase NifS [Candidatus Coatesbacteria bacterium 4484_99]RLC40800.1 MAG: cysteine desulfurase NifS [Candidatus Coatesbacteria bacterium]
MRVYFDNNATTPLDRDVLEEMLPFFCEKFANPMSIHNFGNEAEEALSLARERVAEALECEPDDTIFTSGGSEANNMVLKGISPIPDGKGHIITSVIEHPAILEPCRYLQKHGIDITYIKVDKYGLVDPDDVRRAIRKDTCLITIMHGNNEVGTIEPIEEVARIANEKEIPFHTDAVQSVGKIPLSVAEMGIDLLSLSAHKFNGPKGVGALIARKEVRRKLTPLLHGGEQESGKRASTHNVPGIVGLGKAIEMAVKNREGNTEKVKRLRDMLHRGIIESIPDVELVGHQEKRLPTTLNIAFHYIEGESVQLMLNNKGVAVSTGSACASGKLEPSHVLIEMGYPHEVAQGAVRFSLGRGNTEEEVRYVLEILPEIIEKLRRMSPLTPQDYFK